MSSRTLESLINTEKFSIYCAIDDQNRRRDMAGEGAKDWREETKPK